MHSSPRVLEVTVPASTSNLGPGFDFLGIALSLFLRVRASIDATRGSNAIRSLEGSAEEWPRSAENLLVRAYEHASSRLEIAPHSVAFDARSEIPLARGLGSSGAAVAAGLLLANTLAERRATIDELLAWGLALEGHPDNACAALLGGCTLSVPIPNRGVRVVAQELHPDLGFALAWPARALPTRAARSVLPPTVPFADAVENPRRLALLLEGLRRADPELLSLGSEDRLHFAHRLPLIPGGERAIAAAREAGAWLATISGSGSALIAISSKPRSDAIGRAMSTELERASGHAAYRVVQPVFGPPVVRDLGTSTSSS